MRQDPLLLLILSSLGASGCGLLVTPEAGTACVDVPEDATDCPSSADVEPREAYVPYSCDGEAVRSVSGEGRLTDVGFPGPDTAAASDLACCYDATIVDQTPGSDCVVGRPYREDGVTVVATTVSREDWRGALPAEPSGRDAVRSDAWARAGCFEHASVAAFSRLSLELAAHGAPAALLRDVHLAAIDEIAHAEACFARAAALGGASVGPGAVPFAAPVVPRRALASIAADAVRDGCVGETIGARVARVAAERALERDVRAVLMTIADDEARHAALAWRVVAWALRVGGPEVREAVIAAFRESPAPIDTAELALRAGVDPGALEATVWTAGRDVIAPAAGALLAA